MRGPVVRGQVKVDYADLVSWAGEAKLTARRQITQIDETESAVADQDADRLRILTQISGRRRQTRTERIWLAGAWQGLGDFCTCRGQHRNTHSFERKPVARLQDQPRRLADHVEVGRIVSAGLSTAFFVGTMVGKSPDFDAAGELPNAACMVGMVVCENQ